VSFENLLFLGFWRSTTEIPMFERTFPPAVLLAFLFFGFAGLNCRTAVSKDLGPVPETTGKPRLALETFDTVWKWIYENHFDTNFNGHNWLQVREEYRPRAAAAKTSKELRDTIQQMLDLLHVSHMAIVSGDIAEEIETRGKKSTSVEGADESDSGTVGVDVRFKNKDLLVTRVEPGLSADRAGVKPGWILRRIGVVDTANLMMKTPKSLDARRRSFLAWRAAAKKLSGRPGSQIALEFLDGDNHKVKLFLKREAPLGEAIQFGNLPVLFAHLSTNQISGPNGTRIGFIRFNIWMLPTALAFNRAIDQFRGDDGIILDLRGNVGGMVGMIIGVAGHFMREPASLGAIIARDNTLQLPGNPRFVDSNGRRVEPFAGPVAVLVDEITASASEVFTGGLQELGRVHVFGRVTAGQALPAIYDELPNGDAFYHPIADFITPKGTRFEGRGVIPDEEVPLDRRALLMGKDPALARAVEWIASAPATTTRGGK
jgi:carboxyl-terminal processing protease